MSETRLGPLETRVLDALWTRGCPSSVRDLQPDFPAIAYTTLMTTLDRLHRKGLLGREKQGRAFVYAPRNSRAEYRTAMLSFFVDAVGETDEALLEELEQLIRAKRKEDV